MNILPAKPNRRERVEERLGILPIGADVRAKRARGVRLEPESPGARRRFDRRLTVKGGHRLAVDQIEGSVAGFHEAGEHVDGVGFGRDFRWLDAFTEDRSEDLSIQPFEIDLYVARLAMLPDDVRRIPTGHANAFELVHRIRSRQLAEDIVLLVNEEVGRARVARG